MSTIEHENQHYKYEESAQLINDNNNNFNNGNNDSDDDMIKKLESTNIETFYKNDEKEEKQQNAFENNHDSNNSNNNNNHNNNDDNSLNAHIHVENDSDNNSLSNIIETTQEEQNQSHNKNNINSDDNIIMTEKVNNSNNENKENNTTNMNHTNQTKTDVSSKSRKNPTEKRANEETRKFAPPPIPQVHGSGNSTTNNNHSSNTNTNNTTTTTPATSARSMIDIKLQKYKMQQNQYKNGHSHASKEYKHHVKREEGEAAQHVPSSNHLSPPQRPPRASPHDRSSYGSSPAASVAAASSTSTSKIKSDPRRRFGHFKRCIDDYVKEEKLGEGTYGEVFRARCKKTGELVAIKKIRMDREKEGFPITAIREIIILKAIRHENIVHLREVIASIDKPNFYMVFEYVEHDLAGLLDAKVPFSEGQIKSFMKQLLGALKECHRLKILHRDLKASNLLITQQGVLKLADFGLSRFMQQGKTKYTNRVITRWYRPPELLLGATEYTSKIDMWSVGCILGEMILGTKAVFPGQSELEQLDIIWKTCGTPTMESWPSVSNLPQWQQCKPKQECKRVVRERFSQTHFSKEAIDLLDKLLLLDPEKRLSAEECLQHEWFRKGSEPERPPNLPSQTCNEYGARKRKERGGPPPGHYHHHNHPHPHHGGGPPAHYMDPNGAPPYKKMKYSQEYNGPRGPHVRNGPPDNRMAPGTGAPPHYSGSRHYNSAPHHGGRYRGPPSSHNRDYNSAPRGNRAPPVGNDGNGNTTDQQQQPQQQQQHRGGGDHDGGGRSYHHKGENRSYHNNRSYGGQRGDRRYPNDGPYHGGRSSHYSSRHHNAPQSSDSYHHHHPNGHGNSRSGASATEHSSHHHSSSHHHHHSNDRRRRDDAASGSSGPSQFSNKQDTNAP